MKRSTFLLAAIAAMLFAAGVSAQTTGSIDGAIVDENMTPLPGVTVEATSPALQGTKVAVSDKGGKFHFVFMPPGAYTVKFLLQGFTTVEQTGITVELGRVVALNVQMRSAFKEEIVVSGTSPLLDIRSPEVGANISYDSVTRLPLARSYIAVVQAAPGANQDSFGNVLIYGSGGAENAYYIDGVNTTEVGYGRAGKQLNNEFIQETQVKTGGYQAEFGRAVGGVVNVITKSGGNEFHGDAFGYYDSDKWQAPVSSAVVDYRETRAGASYQSGYKRQDYGVDVGGYVFKDKIWFFAAYDKVKYDNYITMAKGFETVGGPPKGKVYDQTDDRDLWSGKLTWRITPNQSLIASAFGDPRTQSGANTGRTMSGPETIFVQDITRGGTDWSLKYEGVLGTNWVVNVQATQHKEQFNEGGTGFGIPQLRDYTSALYVQTGTAIYTGGLGFARRNVWERDDYRADASYFLSGFGGDHQFKVGGEWEHVPIATNAYHSGGDLIRRRCVSGKITPNGCPEAFTYYQHEVYLKGWPAGGFADPNFADYVINPLAVESKTDSYAVYLQDRWQIGRNLTLDLGVRYEEQKLYNLFQSVSAHLKNEWAPRIGFAWDFKGDGTSKLYGSFGRYYETIPTDMISRAFGGEISTLMSNQDINSVACDAALKAQYGLTCRIVGPQSINDLEPVDPNLKGQFVDHSQIGVEFTVGKDLVLGASYIYRNLGQVIEDALSVDGNYYIGNPGEGLLKESVALDYEHFLPAPKAKRKFTGFELVARKRFSNNWQMMASYLYSKLEGNYDGTFQYSTGQLDPNINSAYDYAEFQVNNYGKLTNDRTHQFKVYGAYMFNFGLSVGGSAYWQSGVPITAYGYNDPYRNYELYLSDRGTWGRTKSEFEGNLQFAYPVKLGGGVDLNLTLSVFNLFNRQGERDIDQNYDLVEIISVVDANGKTLPPIKKGTACTSVVDPGDAAYCNPNFGKTDLWQDPRSIRLGVRLSF